HQVEEERAGMVRARTGQRGPVNRRCFEARDIARGRPKEALVTGEARPGNDQDPKRDEGDDERERDPRGTLGRGAHRPAPTTLNGAVWLSCAAFTTPVPRHEFWLCHPISTSSSFASANQATNSGFEM